MPHLRRHATSGHLLKNAAGHLANACGGCSGCEDLHGNDYIVTISGFPSLCYCGAFNGAWTVAHTGVDCQWECVIDAYHRVRLHYVAGTWRVHWGVTSPGGASGYFVGTGGTACTPEACAYASYDCYEPMFCWGLCAAITANAVVTVEKV